jgi:integrase
MPIYTDKDGRIHVQVEYKKQRRHITKGIKTQAQAKAIETKILEELVNQVEHGIYPDVPITQALNRYRDEISDEGKRWDLQTKLSTIYPFVEGATMSQIVDAADEMADAMEADGYAIATINRLRAILRRVARLAHEYRHWRRCDEPIVLSQALWMQIKPLAGGDNPRNTRLRLPEVHALITAIDNDESRDMATVAIYTGMRIGELYKIGVDYPIDFEHREIYIPLGMQKNHDQDIIPIIDPCPPLPSMEEALRRFPIARCRTSVRMDIKAAAARIGRPEIVPHDLRRTLGSLMVDMNISLEQVGQTLRHRDVATTRRHYAWLDVEAKRRAIVTALSKKAA